MNLTCSDVQAQAGIPEHQDQVVCSTREEALLVSWALTQTDHSRRKAFTGTEKQMGTGLILNPQHCSYSSCNTLRALKHYI